MAPEQHVSRTAAPGVPAARRRDREAGTITEITGVRVGCSTRDGTGVTVVLLPPGTVGSGEVRGGAPATRETALLEPGRMVEQVDAIVLTGGSVFGLATADGVVRFLAERGRGYSTSAGPVPIVPAAAVYDLPSCRGLPPGADDGYAAALAAERGDAVTTGRVGAGAGATVGKWRGVEHAAPGGQGAASARDGDVAVGTLAVVNAIGDVRDVDGRVLAGSSAPPDAPPFPAPSLGSTEHTTLVVVATNARLEKWGCHLLAQSGHVGLAHAVHPSHTRFDGDVAFAVATGEVDAHLDRLRVLAVEATAEAVRSAVI